ncbi:TPA: serine/threonine-protein kinase [Vibrio parahaemolyticus]
MKGPHKSGDCIASRYLIKEYVGEGGMQYVYLAQDQLLGRSVALKTPKNDSAEKRFQRSAIVSARVNHPNVAKTLDYISEDGRNYLIEEFIDGADLSLALISKVDYLDPFLVARILHHLAKGLAASHHAGVIHRDLKPTNVMIINDFQLDSIKITDFGIAKMAEEEIVEAVEGGEDATNASATAVGALPYMAPEAIDTPREMSLKADIWSLGAMTYELLTGVKPFGSGLKAVQHIVTGKYADFPSFLTANPQFSYLTSQLKDIIKKCLVVDPDKRPTADELVSLCSSLCYQVSPRHIGRIKNLEYNAWGFITVPHKNDVFYHVESIYGSKPEVGEKVLFSKYNGGGADRALPVLRLKQ